MSTIVQTFIKQSNTRLIRIAFCHVYKNLQLHWLFYVTMNIYFCIYVNTSPDVVTVLLIFAKYLSLHLHIFTCTYRGVHTDRKENPPPGRVSRFLCSLIKNPEQEDPPRRICTRCFGVLLLRVLDHGTLKIGKPPEGGGSFDQHTSTHVQSAHKRNGFNQAQEPGWKGFC